MTSEDIKGVFSYCCLLNRFIQKIFGIKDDFEITILHHYKKYFKKRLTKESICFSFSECPFQDNIKSYVYQDLSAGLIRDIKNNDPVLFNIYMAFNTIQKLQ